MKIVLTALSAAVLLFSAGCVSYSYKGKKEAASTAGVTVFSDSGKILRPYKVLGVAVVSGNYRQVSRDRMIAKLTSEAKKNGADAVLIVEQQVLPGNMTADSRDKRFFTAFDYDDTSSSWGELYRDVDVTIGNIGKESSYGGAAGDYRRVIRAEFLRYSGAALPPAKK